MHESLLKDSFDRRRKVRRNVVGHRSWFYGGGVAGLSRCLEFLRGQILLRKEVKDIGCEMMISGFDDGTRAERVPKNLR